MFGGNGKVMSPCKLDQFWKIVNKEIKPLRKVLLG